MPVVGPVRLPADGRTSPTSASEVRDVRGRRRPAHGRCEVPSGPKRYAIRVRTPSCPSSPDPRVAHPRRIHHRTRHRPRSLPRHHLPRTPGRRPRHRVDLSKRTHSAASSRRARIVVFTMPVEVFRRIHGGWSKGRVQDCLDRRPQAHPAGRMPPLVESGHRRGHVHTTELLGSEPR